MDDPFALDAEPLPSVQAEPTYIAGLNPPQRQAVETLDGPLLVLSGAGTGKTRVLTTRLVHILSTRRAWPSQTLTVTFTNKAAREMRTRVEALIGPSALEGLWLGTFHSLGLRILRRHAELAGLQPSFSILDADDQVRLLRQVTDAEIPGGDKRWPARHFSMIVQRWKDKGWRPEQVPDSHVGDFADGKGRQLYQAYQERLAALDAVDFGDLLLHNLTLFQEAPDILERYQERFRYISVDEYQDANVAQYLWLRLLAQRHRNICCVGDDDQSIYGWRGAEVANILRFGEDFDGAGIIRLEQNYRSTGDILGAASGLIANNQARLGKTLWTDRSGSQPIVVRTAYDGAGEARMVGEEIEALRREGVAPGQIAVLVRASFQMRAFEERFTQLGLKYRVIGGLRLFERREVRDAIAYLRAILSPEDDLALERIINLPKRGIGDTTVQRMHQLARRERVPLSEAAHRLVGTGELKPAARGKLRAFLDSVDDWRSRLRTEHHAAFAEAVLEESGYLAMWRKETNAEVRGRLEHLAEFLQILAGFDSIQAFIEHVALVMDTDDGSDADSVRIMTMHSAKGLEFDMVFLPGWEEGTFPNHRALQEKEGEGLEEERRLAYVAITRARRRVTISSAMSRMVHGKFLSPLPSRFIDELPAEHVRQAADTEFQAAASFRYAPAAARGGPIIDAPAWREETAAHAPTEFGVGKRVFHQKFGYGVVRSVDREKLTVAFAKAGTKTLIDRFLQPA